MREVSHRDLAEIALPIRYMRSDVFAGLFSADYKAVRPLLPCDALHPVSLFGNRAAVLIFAFNYHETTIGAYGEVGIGIPVRLGSRALPWVPLLVEAISPAWGIFVLSLPVTTQFACELGRHHWGYPKFLAEMNFVSTSLSQSVQVSERGEPILDFSVARKGIPWTDNRPTVTYTILNSMLVRTQVAVRSRYQLGITPGLGTIRLGRHSLADQLRKISISERSLMTRDYTDHSAELYAPVSTGIAC